jgi:predicted dehydrogenase
VTGTALETHLQKPLLYKIRKVVRYVRLYGIGRTVMKIRGQFHMRRNAGFEGDVWINSTTMKDSSFVALVGCGNFPFCNTAYYLRKTARDFLRGAYDLLPERARSLCSDFGGGYAAKRFDTILKDDAVKLVYVASNHATHADYAIAALDAGKHVHIEKPHVISRDQLDRLIEAQKRNPDGMVFLGFNRPKSRLFKILMSWLVREQGPVTINWFVAGHKLPDDHWYYDDAEGSRIAGNVCHWTDLSLQMVGIDQAFPCEVKASCPQGSKSDYAIAILFADGSVANITFSAKGETFEGVREILNLQRGDLIATLDSFERLELSRGPVTKVIKPLFRDHGHRANLVNSYEAVRDGDTSRATSLKYSVATARLFLACHEALREGCPVVVDVMDVKG